jgi:hypothetical protein
MGPGFNGSSERINRRVLEVKGSSEMLKNYEELKI